MEYRKGRDTGGKGKEVRGAVGCVALKALERSLDSIMS